MGPKSKPGEGVYRYEGASKSLVYVNQYFEKNLSTSEVTTHYYLGGKEIAFRKGSTLEYLHTDHLGSTSVTTNTSGPQVSKVAYFSFGGTRYQNGDLGFDKRFTGRRLDRIGLYYYNILQCQGITMPPWAALSFRIRLSPTRPTRRA